MTSIGDRLIDFLNDPRFDTRQLAQYAARNEAGELAGTVPGTQVRFTMRGMQGTEFDTSQDASLRELGRIHIAYGSDEINGRFCREVSVWNTGTPENPDTAYASAAQLDGAWLLVRDHSAIREWTADGTVRVTNTQEYIGPAPGGDGSSHAEDHGYFIRADGTPIAGSAFEDAAPFPIAPDARERLHLPKLDHRITLPLPGDSGARPEPSGSERTGEVVNRTIGDRLIDILNDPRFDTTRLDRYVTGSRLGSATGILPGTQITFSIPQDRARDGVTFTMAKEPGMQDLGLVTIAYRPAAAPVRFSTVTISNLPLGESDTPNVTIDALRPSGSDAWIVTHDSSTMPGHRWFTPVDVKLDEGWTPKGELLTSRIEIGRDTGKEMPGGGPVAPLTPAMRARAGLPGRGDRITLGQ